MMSTINNVAETVNMKVIFSTFWIFTILNYLYCDIEGLMDPKLLKQYMTGNLSGIQITQGFLLGAAILMEIPIAMVLLSRILTYRANRWANIIAGAVMTVVQIATLLKRVPTSYYAFFSIQEIACTMFIVWCAWKMKNLEVN